MEGLADGEVSIGGRYRIGSARFEVTQPRVTRYRVGIRMVEPRMPALSVAHHRPGFYFRVLEEGDLGAGDDIVRVAGLQPMPASEPGRVLSGADALDIAQCKKIPNVIVRPRSLSRIDESGPSVRWP